MIATSAPDGGVLLTLRRGWIKLISAQPNGRTVSPAAVDDRFRSGIISIRENDDLAHDRRPGCVGAER
jgi:hypothetical protein